MPLKCVPLLAGMHGTDTKLDLHAIYRRRKQDNWGTPTLDDQGREQWDLTGPLPLRRHQDYVTKGYEYVTLADEESLVKAIPVLEANGLRWQDYAYQDRRTRSPFSQALYLEDATSDREKEVADLRELIAEFGLDAVVKIKRKENPAFELPADLKLEPAVAKGRKA